MGVRAGARERAYAYDGDGNLRRETSSDEPRALSYALDLAGPLSQVLTASDGRDEAAYLYGLGRIAAFGPATRYYGADVRGSVRSSTDERGKVAFVQRYDAWGTPNDQGDGSAKLASLFGYAGERQDAKLGLEQLRARWYAPDLGAFLSRDPAPGSRSDPRSLAPYAYAANAPTSRVDPSGRSASGLFDGPNLHSYDGTTLYIDPDAGPTPTPRPGPRPSALPSPGGDVHVPSPDEVVERSIGPAAIGIAGLAAAGEARAERLLERGLADALSLRQRAAAPDPSPWLRLPIVRDVRSAGLQLQANVRELTTRVAAGSLKVVYRVSATAGGVLTASGAAAEQLREDAPRTDLSVDARLARAAFRGIVTGASSAVLGVAAGAACAPATLTVAGAVVTAGCAVGGAAAGEAARAAFSRGILQWFDPRFGF